jgi:trehalose 6-phosphate phosphatase
VAESSRDTDGSLERALALATDALRASPAGLLTDFDGTLSPIVAHPELARLVDGAAGALETLARRLAVVAIVTGRAPRDARRMTGVPDLLVVGNHGTEWLEPGADEPIRSVDAERIGSLVTGVVERLPALEGVTVEDKGLSATVHYRNAPDPAEARDAVLEAIGRLPDGLELRDGRMSVELRPIGLGDKGAATRAIIERFGLRGVVVMGDDVTDLDMFAAVDRARAAGRLRAAIVAVGGPDAEVPGEVAAAADTVLPGVDDSAALLARLASALD